MKKTLDAKFTVEAAILVPLLIMVIMSASYLVVFAYDRALLNLDMNSAISELRLSEEDFEREIVEIKKEHPYIGVTEPQVYVSKLGKRYEVMMKCRWRIPVWNDFEREIVVKREISTISPTELMRFTEDIIEELEERNEN